MNSAASEPYASSQAASNGGVAASPSVSAIAPSRYWPTIG